MRLPFPWHTLQLVLLRSASLLVPGVERAEWRREWLGELWHVRLACAEPSWAGQRNATAFCLGAFQDALCVRRAGRETHAPAAGIDGTPRQCLLILAALLAAAYAVALLLPGVRAERSLWTRKVNPNLVLIEDADAASDAVPSIAPGQFRAWQGRKQRYFDGFAFYHVTQEKVDAALLPRGAAGSLTWGVARASSNLFMLLGLPVRFAEAGTTGNDAPQVILSEAMWKREFGADTHIAGSEIKLGGSTARVAGVAPDGSLALPGQVDAWILESDVGREASEPGFVVAHLTAAGAAEMWSSRVRIAANSPDDSEDDLLGISLADWRPSAWIIYLFGGMLALLALPAITSVSMGDYSVNPQRTSWTRRLYRWSFMSAKVALLLPIVHFLSLDLGYGWTPIGREGEAYLQLAAVFGLCLFGMQWALKDQRQRCPVCLRRVAHPAQVGQASRTFLDWNGTEMMCMGGHTLLHVPSLPTSWFGTQRWLYLDTSWEFLFAGPEGPGA